jgi:hypothetical protein
MTDPTQTGEQGGPSEEEVQQYLEQLRSAEASEIIAQAFNMLATGAQVKLGRPDARVLIDALAGMVDNVGGQLPEQIGQQMRDSVGQLQSAQVQAEQEAAGAQPGEQQEAPSGADQAGEAQSAGEQSGSGQRMTDRLWIPGQSSGGGR